MPWIADKWGRKWGCAVPCMLLVISGAVMTGSVNIGMFLAFRFFSGAGSFMILAVVPILMNEIVPVSIRGALVDIHGVMLVLGYTIQGWVGFGFCRDAEAERILIKLHNDPRDPENVIAAAEFYQIKKQMAIDRTLGSSWLHIIKKPSYRKRALLAIGTCGIVQCSGVLVINNYGPTLYKDLGFSPVQQLLYPAAWLTFAWGMNAVAMLLVDRFPRPKYMAFGVLGCMSSLIVEAALVATYLGTSNKSALLACVAMFFVFQVFYALCLDGTQFSYLGEVFPTHIRAKGICLGVAMISLMNIIWLQSAPVAFIKIGWKFYLALCHVPVAYSGELTIYGSIGGILMFLYFPDTNGVPLEEVAAIFGDADEVAVYERDLDFEPTTHAAFDAHMGEKGRIQHAEAGL
ncbi:hypothetical protein B0A55_04043 [Friedmanniomyces simplex]|uniref:Major facilitator superfamily (MFS) profile domain-containing protein n=1 Tax=Friedmanniomyces simplex TaxID=329884 RepID=A0A4U0XH83_9PEZI|nr:hypothetical protein B0A55_04043 [Friedmanniomyces simplex]